MKPLPLEVLDLLASLPDEKPCKIVLNTNGQGHWEVEVFARYVFEAVDETGRVSRLKSSRRRLTQA